MKNRLVPALGQNPPEGRHVLDRKRVDQRQPVAAGDLNQAELRAIRVFRDEFRVHGDPLGPGDPVAVVEQVRLRGDCQGGTVESGIAREGGSSKLKVGCCPVEESRQWLHHFDILQSAGLVCVNRVSKLDIPQKSRARLKIRQGPKSNGSFRFKVQGSRSKVQGPRPLPINGPVLPTRTILSLGLVKTCGGLFMPTPNMVVIQDDWQKCWRVPIGPDT